MGHEMKEVCVRAKRERAGGVVMMLTTQGGYRKKEAKGRQRRRRMLSRNLLGRRNRRSIPQSEWCDAVVYQVHLPLLLWLTQGCADTESPQMSLHKLSAEERWGEIGKQTQKENESAIASSKETLFDVSAQLGEKKRTYSNNIENFIGTVKIPVGVAGPLHVKGTQGERTYFIPLATTEAALVASVSRGCKALTAGGGVCARVVDQRVARAPVFVFDSLDNAIKFISWIHTQNYSFTRLASTTTKHGKLISVKTLMEGTRVNVKFEYHTGDAAGQNMATFATNKILEYIKQQYPPGLVSCAVEGGHASDKKGSSSILQGTRGRKVVVDVTLPKEVIRDVFRTTPAALEKQRMHAAYGHSTIGQIGTVSGNVANVLTAIYMACGQDPACVVEGHIGIARFEQTDKGDLHCSLTLPGLLMATVGGGTSLSSQSACLSILNCKSANELAEVIGAACLAGELSITAFFCTDEFAKAHFNLARGGSKL